MVSLPTCVARLPMNRKPIEPGRSDLFLVLRKFFREGTSVATAAPSSRWMAKSILHGIDFDRVKTIVELGAGTGPITVEILKRLKPHTKFFVVEIDPDFCNRLRQRFPSLDIVEGDAAKLDTLLAERGFDGCDEVISGLPIPSFPEGLRRSILAASARALGPAGVFRQLTIMPLVYQNLYRRYFADVKFRFVPLNIPPGGVYMCQGYKNETGTV
jgi:phospholipid N-methyltransferase